MERQVRERFERIEGILEGIAQRQDRFDRQMQTTRKLVEAGIKMVTRLAKDTRELKQSQKAFLDFVPQRWNRQNALSLIASSWIPLDFNTSPTCRRTHRRNHRVFRISPHLRLLHSASALMPHLLPPFLGSAMPGLDGMAWKPSLTPYDPSSS